MAVTIQPGARADTQTLPVTLGVVIDNAVALLQDPRSAKHLPERPLEGLVSDRGYHSNETMTLAAAIGWTSYISEPDRGRRLAGQTVAVIRASLPRR